MKCTYKEMPTKLQNLENFTGNSVTAITWGDVYYVYSYNTLIFKYDKLKKSMQLNVTKYSRTTSKLQRMLQQIFPNSRHILFLEKDLWVGDFSES